MSKRASRELSGIALGCLLGLASTATIAAEVGGTVRGRVTKEAGGAVAGAVIKLTHKEKNVTRTAEANAEGEYVVRNLPVGEYEVTISGEGFNTAKQESLAVLVGAPVTLDVSLQAGETLEEVVVTGIAISRVNMAASTAGMTFDDARLEMLPVDNGFEEMALLTPGAVETGGANFNGASSISGASSAENGYYLNGINVTQIQSGLGSFRLPWEAVEQTNVQTGGATAEFGGALGGIVNAVSKTGSNEFKFGSEYRNDPGSAYGQFDSIRSISTPDEYWINRERSEDSFTESSFWISGPVLKDRLFFYGLYNPVTERWADAAGSQFRTNHRTADRWFGNLEWFMTENHSIRLTGFNTKRELTTKNYGYDDGSDTIEDFNGKSMFEDGGYFYGAAYHGELSNLLSVDIVAGRTQEEEVPRPGNNNPLVSDCRTGSCFDYSNHSNTSINPQEFVRDQLRADLTFDFRDHAVKVGMDSYKIDVDVDTRQTGAVIGSTAAIADEAAFGWWEIRTSNASDAFARDPRVNVPIGDTYVRRRVRVRFTDSEVTSKAFYIQDTWQVTDNLVFDMGVRNSSFENTVSSGEAYVEMDNNIEPRFGAVWDVQGDGKTKAYLSVGRYYQPVAARMNIVQGASSIEYFDFYTVAGVDSTGRPVLRDDGSPDRGTRYGERLYRQLGITDPNLIASKNLKAMYSDQFAVGFETEVFESLRGGVRFTYSELGRSVEDTDYGPVLVNKLAELGITDALGQDSFYILSNPGKDVQIAFDFDQDGDVDSVTLAASETQLPKPERKYAALLFTLGGELTDSLFFDASYTWSHSYGNTEGLVKTDNDQADPGWTTSYDYGDLMDYAYGNLPNDRRHSFRFLGSYEITPNWTAGMVFRATSGAPKSVFAVHPEGIDGCDPTSPWNACVSRSYGEVSHYNDRGQPIPRGSAGRLPWVTSLDLSLQFRMEDLFGGNFSVKATLYNALGQDKPLAINQIDVDQSIVAGRDDYGLTSIYQKERFLSLVGRLEF